MRKSRVLLAIIAYALYFLSLFKFALTYAVTGSAPGYYLPVAGVTFLAFAVITIIGVTRWTRKKFPYKEKNRNA